MKFSKIVTVNALISILSTTFWGGAIAQTNDQSAAPMDPVMM